MHTQEEVLNLVSDLGNGVGVLMMLAGRTPTILGREVMLEAFTAFEGAYQLCAELQAAGELEGPGPLTLETGECVTRLGALLRLAPESTEAQDAAAEIQSLAKQCLKTLAPDVRIAA